MQSNAVTENHIKSKMGFPVKATSSLFPHHTLAVKRAVKLVTEASTGIGNISKSNLKFCSLHFPMHEPLFITSRLNFKNESEKRPNLIDRSSCPFLIDLVIKTVGYNNILVVLYMQQPNKFNYCCTSGLYA